MKVLSAWRVEHWAMRRCRRLVARFHDRVGARIERQRKVAVSLSVGLPGRSLRWQRSDAPDICTKVRRRAAERHGFFQVTGGGASAFQRLFRSGCGKDRGPDAPTDPRPPHRPSDSACGSRSTMPVSFRIAIEATPRQTSAPVIGPPQSKRGQHPMVGLCPRSAPQQRRCQAPPARPQRRRCRDLVRRPIDKAPELIFG